MKQEHSGILVFAEQKNRVIHRVSFELLAKARELSYGLGCAVSCVVLGKQDMDVRELVAKGADTVYHIAHPHAFGIPDEMIYASNIVSLIKDIKPEVCLFGATSFGRSLAPRIAAALGTGLTADCTQLEISDGQFVQIRPAFSENILAHIWSDTFPKMATVRYKEFSEAPADNKRVGEIKVLPAGMICNDFVETVVESEQRGARIADSEVVISAGMGAKSPEAMGCIHELANLLGGMVGASRAMVETGTISKEYQVGYSGNRVKPKLYVACGLSGAPQHIAGMKDSGCIVAINNDPSAPIFNIADIGIVGDAGDVLGQLVVAVKEAKKSEG